MPYYARGRGRGGYSSYGYGGRSRGLRYRGRGGRGRSVGRGGSNYPVARHYLPDGWQLAYTEDGEAYYVDHHTQTTHWTLPKEVQEKIEERGRGRGRGRGFGRGRGRGGLRRGGAYHRGVDRRKMKTKMCMNIENGGTCPFGDKCAFAHSPGELHEGEEEEEDDS